MTRWMELTDGRLNLEFAMILMVVESRRTQGKWAINAVLPADIEVYVDRDFDSPQEAKDFITEETSDQRLRERLVELEEQLVDYYAWKQRALRAEQECEALKSVEVPPKQKYASKARKPIMNVQHLP